MKKKITAVGVLILGTLSVINVFLRAKKEPLNYGNDRKELCGENVCKRDKTQRKLEREAIKNPSEINEANLLPEDEKKERRNTRITPIIGIIATIIALAAFLFELSRGLLDIWEIQGIMFECGFVVYWLILASVILIGLDILLFISTDLHRYNVQEEKCKEYDDKADRVFYNLIWDYNVCKWTLIVGNILIIILGTKYLEGAEKWIILFTVAGSAIMLVYGVFHSFKKETGKKEKLEAIALGGGKLVSVFLISLLISISFYSDDNLNFSVKYDVDGTVDINLSSEFTKTCGVLSVRINDGDNNPVYDEIIEKEELLASFEEKMIC